MAKEFAPYSYQCRVCGKKLVRISKANRDWHEDNCRRAQELQKASVPQSEPIDSELDQRALDMLQRRVLTGKIVVIHEYKGRIIIYIDGNELAGVSLREALARLLM